MIEFRGVNKWFGPLHVLKDITLSVEPREVVVVCGPSGSGKSTLIRCINGLETIKDGDLVVDGQHVGERASNMTQLRAEIGFVFQQFNLYPHKTALENVTLAPIHVRKIPRVEAKSAGRELLAKVGLADKFDAYPAELSGGQQQRVAIARSLCMRPKIMLFDEPTSALDPEMISEVRSARRHGRRSRGKHDHDGGDPRDGLCTQGRQAGRFHRRRRHRRDRYAGGVLLPPQDRAQSCLPEQDLASLV